MTIKVTLWGVRGSFPCATPNHMIYGGNTSCVSVEVGDAMVILDAGTGLWQLGKYILKKGIDHATLLLSHSHTDHIIGFPFFAPAWVGRFHLDILAGHLTDNGGVEAIFQQAMHDPVFPVKLSAMPSRIRFQDFHAGESLILPSGIFAKTGTLNHPNGCTGYRLEIQGKVICYITDTEHVVGERDPHVMALVKDADLMIYDSTYSDEQYANGKVGWGHSTWQEALRIAEEAGVKQTVIYHHDPDHTDEVMAAVEAKVKAVSDKAVVAREGMVFEY